MIVIVGWIDRASIAAMRLGKAPRFVKASATATVRNEDFQQMHVERAR